ncbi:MAG: twin-arginine translocation signal domain-containing protein [Bacteroidales bacterium]|nr:twin-arginine translocation signal domain-containing protein [Bacteroidales bacterium]
MNNRRNFLKKSLAVTSGVLLAGPLLAGTKRMGSGKFPGVIYTETDQGMWVGKASIHIPKITVSGGKVTMFTDHPMTEPHYIVRHTLVNELGVVIGSKTFMPSDPKAISTHTLPDNFKGKLYATSFCNRHDFWVKEFEI